MLKALIYFSFILRITLVLTTVEVNVENLDFNYNWYEK